MELLQVNDVLFSISRVYGLKKVTIDKITPAGNLRISDGALLTPELRKKTSDNWDDTAYYHWSPDLEERLNLQLLQNEVRKRLKKIDAHQLNKDTLEKLLKILNDLKL